MTFVLNDLFKKKTIKANPDIKSLIVFSDFERSKHMRHMTQYYYKNNYDVKAHIVIENI
ncbi:hypothetical protein IRB23SM22_17400 [Alkalibacterium sp. s-m-22]|uniref:Uncharacterized protein n=1 Tax=Alkalibacterium indicireducens TaxID=398758 RepID=A0ABN1AJP8_9LACT